MRLSGIFGMYPIHTSQRKPQCLTWKAVGQAQKSRLCQNWRNCLSFGKLELAKDPEWVISGETDWLHDCPKCLLGVWQSFKYFKIYQYIVNSFFHFYSFIFILQYCIGKQHWGLGCPLPCNWKSAYNFTVCSPYPPFLCIWCSSASLDLTKYMLQFMLVL